MPVEQHEIRARSDAEVAFVVMRALIRARLLWADGGALPSDALPALVAAAPGAVAVAIERLCEEGVAEMSTGQSTVCLTERAARELCGRPEGDAPLRRGPLPA